VKFYEIDKGVKVTAQRKSKQEPESDSGPKPVCISPKDMVDILAESGFRMSREVSLATHGGGILYEDHGEDIRILLVESLGKDSLVLPKGHIEAGESTKQTAQREVIEETGYGLLEGDLFGTYSYSREVRTAYYLMNAKGQSPRESREKRRLEWVKLKRRQSAWKLDSAVERETTIPADVVAILERAAQAIAVSRVKA
jgi:8-oxo-dGTP pyrophosphatase MutT (NUDIX family)